MAKEKMVCPFTKRMCVNCSIYRGRHYYMCFSKGYQGCLLESGEIEKLKSEPKTVSDFKFDMPDKMPVSTKRINNVEDVVVGLDFQTVKV
jgi:hypothetical protein